VGNIFGINVCCFLGSLIKVTLGNDTISLVFRDNDKMAKFVDEIRNRIRLSGKTYFTLTFLMTQAVFSNLIIDTHHLQQRSHFSWLTYTDRNASATSVTGSGASSSLKRSITDSIVESWTSKSSVDEDTLPYTALLQRSSTMRSTKLDMDLVKRLTLRRDSFEVKKSWLSARMRDREDEFVDWQDIRSVKTVHHCGQNYVLF
jgi:hypothetical protein